MFGLVNKFDVLKERLDFWWKVMMATLDIAIDSSNKIIELEKRIKKLEKLNGKSN